MLLDAGLDIDSRDYKGRIALHGAASKNYEGVVELLLVRGARLDLINEKGKRPMTCLLTVLSKIYFKRKPRGTFLGSNVPVLQCAMRKIIKIESPYAQKK